MKGRKVANAEFFMKEACRLVQPSRALIFLDATRGFNDLNPVGTDGRKNTLLMV